MTKEKGEVTRVDAGGFCLSNHAWGPEQGTWRKNEMAGELELWDPDKRKVIGRVKPSPDNFIYDLDPEADETSNASYAVGSARHLFGPQDPPLGAFVSVERHGVRFLGVAMGGDQVGYCKYRGDNFLRDAPTPLRRRLKHGRKRR